MSNLADLDRLYDIVKEQKGHIDILFANAGVGGLVPLEAITEAHFDKIFNINVKGLLFTVQKALPIFQDGGSIILNASIASSKGFEASSVYSAAKTAVRSFARTWTVDLKQRRIRVNAISPVDRHTGPRGLGAGSELIEQFKARIVSAVPLRRMGNPDEVAKAVPFLPSGDSGYVTGIELSSTGVRHKSDLRRSGWLKISRCTYLVCLRRL